jgi:HSP20 family molecular chaperone IbpA
MNPMTPGPQDRLLAQLAMIPASQTPNDGVDWFPPVDIAEDDDEYLFKVDLPEVNPANLRVAVEEDGLVICGERPNLWQGERKLLRVERPHGYFVRRFALPDDANTREINTLFAESVLEVRIRKVSSRMQTPAPTNAPPRLRLRSAA